ncbi:MAG: GNAT family N-acetyltransferase [Anaerolineae bacterium]|nr:GNAT family N-acetyltransferase [Anaerolineae bacterium]MDW8100602.1 GNAT family N-acetyltransferase [Anaerolineae bacterium]
MSQRSLSVHIRPLRPEEIKAWVALINAADAVDELGRATTVEEALVKLRSPGYGYDHVLLGWLGQQLVGYADLWLQSDGRAIGGVTVHPRFRRRGIGHQLLRRLIALAKEKGAWCLDVPVVPRITAAVALLTSAGCRLARRWWEMVWVGHHPPPPSNPPTGVRLRTYRGQEDAAAWIELDATAFSGHWGAAPLTMADVVAITSRPDFDPAGLWFAEISGKLIGQALARCSSREQTPIGTPIGRIEDVAVLPAYRGYGVGRALLLAAMNYLWERGCRVIELTVDTENAEARHLYDALGFVEIGQLHWYRCKLSHQRKDAVEEAKHP